MKSSMPEVAFDFPPFLRVYKDGRVERLMGTDVVSPSVDSKTGVESKDVVISPETGVSARLYIPKTTNPTQKLPLLVYFHGGAFCIGTPFSPRYHNYINSLVAEANAVAVSVGYRRAPEYPIPIAYDDSWAALKWISSHSSGQGPEQWLNDHADFQRVFIAGDSAGANIAHNMALRAGLEGLVGVTLVGVVLLHPYFWGKERVGGETTDADKRALIDRLWRVACPATSGSDDPLINPAFGPKLSSLGCKRVLVYVAEKDLLKDRGWYYYDLLGKSGWGGVVEIMESEGEEHVFHLHNTTCDNAVAMLKRLVSFLNLESG